MKKMLLITPPINIFYFPMMTLPTLVAQLRNKGYDVSAMDMNIDFLRYVYSKDYLEKTIVKAKDVYKDLESKKETFYNKNMSNYINEVLTCKYDLLHDFIQNESKIKEKVPASIEKAIKILKDEKFFYNPKLLKLANQIIEYINRFICMPYLPYEFHLATPTYYEEIVKIIFDRDFNIFFDYFEKQIDKIKELNFDYIGISINANNQLLAGLTLAYLLKKETNAHINLGGDSCSRLVDFVPHYKDFFEIFADSISYGEGENSIIELARYINGEIDITDVPQFLFKDEKTGQVKKTLEGKPIVLSQIQWPDYSDFDLDKYFFPERVLPLQIQRGCYWDKCTFCDCAFSKTPSAKKIFAIIEELKYNKEKYNVSTYMVVDEAITPEILERLSDAIIESGLNVRFSTHARLEKRYNYNLFKKMYDAGFRNIWWGLETANPRGQRLINKGIDLNAVPQILEDANRAGIMNSILCVVCFPLVTYEEDMDTYKFLKQYSEYVQCFVFHKFSLTKFSRVYMDFEKYKITIPEDTSKSRVSLYYSFKKKEGMNDLEESKIIDQFYQYYRYDKTNYFFSPDYNLLYISKYGLKWMKKKLIKKEKNKIFFKKFFSNFSLRRK